MFRSAALVTLLATAAGTGPSLADPTAFPSFPASTATPRLGTPAIPPPSLPGPMASYAWFPGRWACRTGLAGKADREPTPGKLYVVADPAHAAIKEYFSSTTPDGKPYRIDDVLTYDAAEHAFMRRSIDQNGAQVALIAKAPYAREMRYIGYLGLQNRKIYRMRATVTLDADQTQMSTETAFYSAPLHDYKAQSTTVCTKIVL